MMKIAKSTTSPTPIRVTMTRILNALRSFVSAVIMWRMSLPWVFGRVRRVGLFRGRERLLVRRRLFQSFVFRGRTGALVRRRVVEALLVR